MKQKELEIILQKVPMPKDPNPNLEQYMTPATIAAEIIFNAYQFGDIENKIIVDLGCGTGIFSVGALLAGAEKVIAVDIDKNIIKIAKEYSEKNDFVIEFIVKDVRDVHIRCNTVIMNPPFGAQKSNHQADRKFLEKGFEIANIIYSIHLKKTVSFIEKLVSSLNGEITYQKDYRFPIKWMFNFHKKEIVNFDVSLLRINTEH